MSHLGANPIVIQDPASSLPANPSAVEAPKEIRRGALAKAFLDCICAAAGLVILSPLLMLVAVAIALDDGFPVVFRQRRVGRGGMPFELVKFRSMRNNAPGAAITSAGDPRFTRVGRLLRRSKFDELPQLWNVLKGDMSLVGPRPEIPPFVDYASPTWRAVLSVKPGITDLASLVYREEETILGRSIDPEQFYRQSVLPAKLALSLEYMENRSFWLDLKLISLTLLQGLFPSRFEPRRILELILRAKPQDR